MRPGVEIISRAQPLPRSVPTDTSVWFVAGATATGPTVPTLITSMTQYESTFGTRTGVGTALWDAIEAYFREGGARVYVSKAATSSEADALAALAKFGKALGPGQVSLPGVITVTAQTALLDHAKANNRVAILDGKPDGTATELDTNADALRALPTARYGGLFAPSAIIPGVAAGTTREVPYSAIEAGIIARNDPIYGANTPAAGVLGTSVYATDLKKQYTDAEYQTLNESGVNMARMIYGGVETYGYRTLVDPAGNDRTWLSLGNARVNMAITAQADAIGERYVFAQIDGRRRKIAQFGAELSAMLVPFWESDSLYGETADQAFAVDVGEQVNTDQTIANGELHAVLTLRMSPFSELVVIEIVKVATTEAIAA